MLTQEFVPAIRFSAQMVPVLLTVVLLTSIMIYMRIYVEGVLFPIGTVFYLPLIAQLSENLAAILCHTKN